MVAGKVILNPTIEVLEPVVFVPLGNQKKEAAPKPTMIIDMLCAL